MKRTIALFVLVLAIAPAAHAQPRWSRDHDPHVAAVGLAAGLTSGTGLALRWPVLPQVMASVAGGVWGSSDDLAWNTGFEAHYILRQSGRLRFFAGPAVAWYSDRKEDDVDINVSGGIGIEWLYAERVSFKVDLGFTYQSDEEKTYPLPQASVFFYF